MVFAELGSIFPKKNIQKPYRHGISQLFFFENWLMGKSTGSLYISLYCPVATMVSGEDFPLSPAIDT
jgi:hypothetical protein